MTKQKTKLKKQSALSLKEIARQEIEKILDNEDKQEVRSLFAFDDTDTQEEVLFKFNLWGRYFHTKYYKVDDAPYHKEIDEYNYQVYRNEIDSFTDIVFRNGAKTTRTKLFIAYCISNDRQYSRKYIKYATKDITTAKQVVTDIYNMFITPRTVYFYPEIFEKTPEKREESMSSFTTSTGIKMTAGTVGTEQRGQIQEDIRPDWILFDDFETRKTLRSAVVTQAIWDNMEEARTGLAKDGSCAYLCNYLSERGNVHKLVQKANERNIVLIVPIKKDGKPTWQARDTIEEVEAILKQADDPHGEYMCEPSAGFDIFFDRQSLDKQIAIEPLREVAGFKIFYEYKPSHRYGSGHDVAGGVGLDSSTSVFIDFSQLPNRVVATYASNTIEPDIFGDEIRNQANRFGEPIVAVENNKFDMCIGRLKQIYKNLYFTEQKQTRVGVPPRVKQYGWNTNTMTKPKMLFELKQAVEDGLLELTDKDLIAEMRSYTRDDLMDRDEDPRLATRHFDILIACAIAWQMRTQAKAKATKSNYKQPKYESPLLDE